MKIFGSHSFSNEVVVNFNMFSASMEHRISLEEGSSKIVAPKSRSRIKDDVEFS